jgi:hypothetical protein
MLYSLQNASLLNSITIIKIFIEGHQKNTRILSVNLIFINIKYQQEDWLFSLCCWRLILCVKYHDVNIRLRLELLTVLNYIKDK